MGGSNYPTMADPSGVPHPPHRRSVTGWRQRWREYLAADPAVYGVLALAVAALPLELFPSAEVAGISLRLHQPLFLLLAFMVGSRLMQGRFKLARGYVWPGVVFVGAMALSIPLSLDPMRSVVVWGFTVYTVFVFILLSQLLRSQHALNTVILIWVSAISVVSIFGMYQVIGDGRGWPTGLLPRYTIDGSPYLFARAQGTAREPLHFASMLAFPLLLVAGSFLSAAGPFRRGRIALPILAVLSTGLLLTWSRGGLLASLVGFLCLFALLFRHLRWKRVVCIGAAGLVTVPLSLGVHWLSTPVAPRAVVLETLRTASLFNTFVTSYEEQFASAAAQWETRRYPHIRTTTAESAEPLAPTATTPPVPPPQRSGFIVDRLATWRGATRAWRERPVVGIGLGTFANFFLEDPDLPRTGKGGEPFAERGHRYRPSVNNVFLELLAETGILGLLGFAGVLGMLLLQTVRLRRVSPIPVVFGCALIAILLQWATFSPVYITHLWAFLGVYAVTLRLAAGEPGPGQGAATIRPRADGV